MLVVTAPMIQFVTSGGKVRHATRGDVLNPSEVKPEHLAHLKSLGFVEPTDAEPTEPDKPEKK